MNKDMKKKTVCMILTAAFLLSGCSEQASVQENPDGSAAEQTTAEAANPAETDAADTALPAETEPSGTTAADDPVQQYAFNPHLYVPLLADDVPQDYWDSFYHLCDALRAGETTFACSGEEAYKWATNPSTLNQLFPAGCTKITGESSDGTAPFENGTGRIYYQIPPDEFVEREAQFEALVADVLNQYLEPDDDEFEKCLKLFDYISTHYAYEYEFVEHKPDGATYIALTEGNGQCVDMSSAYSYLLLQAGVQALEVGCSTEAIAHAWTYVVINGKGYHSDATWGLRSGDDDLCLSYFLMSGERREYADCPVDDLTAPLLPKYWLNRSSLNLSDDNAELCFPLGAFMKSLDEENKVVHYTVNNEESELHYAQP